MNEWKEFRVNDLVSDIFKPGVYEFEWLFEGRWCGAFTLTNESEWAGVIAGQLYKPGHDKLYYRKPEPKAPTHEEICSKWWSIGSGYE